MEWLKVKLELVFFYNFVLSIKKGINEFNAIKLRAGQVCYY